MIFISADCRKFFFISNRFFTSAKSIFLVDHFLSVINFYLCQKYFLAKECAQYWLKLRGLNLPSKMWKSKLTEHDMAPFGWLNHKTSIQSNISNRFLSFRKYFPCQQLVLNSTESILSNQRLIFTSAECIFSYQYLIFLTSAKNIFLVSNWFLSL